MEKPMSTLLDVTLTPSTYVDLIKYLFEFAKQLLVEWIPDFFQMFCQWIIENPWQTAAFFLLGVLVARRQRRIHPECGINVRYSSKERDNE